MKNNDKYEKKINNMQYALLSMANYVYVYKYYIYIYVCVNIFTYACVQM